MSIAVDIFTVIAVTAGAFFIMAGTVGLLRFPDALTRLHALTKADNLGLGLIVLGLLPRVSGPLDALKLVVMWLLVQLAGATAAQLIAREARRDEFADMTVDFVLDCVVAALAAVAAGWTIIARESFAAVVRFVTFGLLLTLAWVRLDAIDVAVTEGAIGSGLTGALLLGAALRLRTSEGSTAAEKPGVALRFAAALFSAAVATQSSSACSPRTSRAR